MAGKRETREPTPRNRKRQKREGVLDCRDVPSPPPLRRSRAEAEAAGGPDAAAVMRLAASGLSLGEILAELGWAEELSDVQRAAVEAAMRRGRALGSAALKQAQYRAALEGRVTAQAQMLALLEDGPTDSGSEGVTVRRRILDATDDAGD